MGRKNYIPGSNATDRKVIPYDQDSFAAGLIKDFPASEIPNNAIAKGSNVVVMPNEIQGRLGCELYTTNELPPLTDRTGLIGSKTGYIITCTSNIFTEADVGNYWVWPGAETTHEEIIRYINGMNVEVATSSTWASTTGCYMRGKMNLWHFHSVLKKWLFLLSNEFWTADVEMNTWTRIQIISATLPTNAVSQVQEYDNWSWIVFNPAGHFHVSSYWEKTFAWKRNFPIPNVAIPDITATLTSACAYNYVYAAARLTEMGNFVDRLYPSRIEVESGTNYWDENLRDWGEVNTDDPIDSTNSQVIGPLYVPQVNNVDPIQYQQHLTHFPIYRTLELINKYQEGQIEAIQHDPTKYIWLCDLRICAAFLARKYNGHVLARYGEFEPADVGSTIEWEDGTRDTIIEYIAPDEVVIDHVMYYDIDTDYMACAIGNGRVFRASQTGTTVTRTRGDTFTAADVGKTIQWSTGYRSVIEAYVNANTVTVHDDQDKVSQGITTDAKYRHYCDTTSDLNLKNRTHEMLCRNRFMTSMPDVNDGIVVPGFMITARRGEKELYFTAWETNYEYLSSFYNPGYQYSTAIKDPIQKLLKHPTRFSALCQNHRTWWGPTNTSEMLTLDGVYVPVPVLSGIDLLDGSIGCFDFGSIQEIDNGMYVMLTKEPSGVGVRKFNGYEFGPNMLEIPKAGQTTIQKDLEKLQRATASLYDGIMGYVVWGRENS